MSNHKELPIRTIRNAAGVITAVEAITGATRYVAGIGNDEPTHFLAGQVTDPLANNTYDRAVRRWIADDDSMVETVDRSLSQQLLQGDPEFIARDGSVIKILDKQQSTQREQLVVAPGLIKDIFPNAHRLSNKLFFETKDGISAVGLEFDRPERVTRLYLMPAPFESDEIHEIFAADGFSPYDVRQNSAGEWMLVTEISGPEMDHAQIMIANLTTHEVRLLDNNHQYSYISDLAWVDDATVAGVVYTSAGDSRAYSIWVVNVETLEERLYSLTEKVGDGVIVKHRIENGQAVFSVGYNVPSHYEVFKMDLQTGEITGQAELPGPVIESEWSPTGEEIALVIKDMPGGAWEFLRILDVEKWDTLTETELRYELENVRWDEFDYQDESLWTLMSPAMYSVALLVLLHMVARKFHRD